MRNIFLAFGFWCRLRCYWCCCRRRSRRSRFHSFSHFVCFKLFFCLFGNSTLRWLRFSFLNWLLLLLRKLASHRKSVCVCCLCSRRRHTQHNWCRINTESEETWFTNVWFFARSKYNSQSRSMITKHLTLSIHFSRQNSRCAHLVNAAVSHWSPHRIKMNKIRSTVLEISIERNDEKKKKRARKIRCNHRHRLLATAWSITAAVPSHGDVYLRHFKPIN